MYSTPDSPPWASKGTATTAFSFRLTTECRVLNSALLAVSNTCTPGTPASDIVAYATTDPSIVYEIQANGSIAVADIGSQADFTTITAGSTVTGLSALMLDTATLTNSGNASLRIIDIASGPDNVAGDSFTIVQVQIAEHQNVADRAAY